MRKSQDTLAVVGIFSALLILCAMIYWPGLNGTFLFDDQANLSRLQKIASPLTWEQLTAFASSGTSGPLGRPLSMLTFGLQFQSWPSDPGAFKLVNLLLHLANGALVFWLFTAIGKAAQWKGRTNLLAGLIAAAWLLHPIQVSTTLYIVQRMTLLASFFTLAGLVTFVEGRRLVQAGSATKGYLIAGAGIALGTALAIAGKESGALLPLYALAIEATLLSHSPAGEGWKKWKVFVLYLPLLAALAVFFSRFESLTHYQGRGFSLVERLLTEPRVLMDYLRKILLLPPYNFGVFFDDFTVSRGFLSPPTTLAAILAIFGLLFAALRWRLSFPFFSFAILWFFCGHTLESSVIPLELYFEHRNYLPSLGIVAGIVLASHALLAHRLPESMKIPSLMIGGIFLVMLALTWQQTHLWGNSLVQAVIWAKEKPLSQRSMERAGTMFALAGNPEKASEYFMELGQKFPDIADGPMFQLYLTCHFPHAAMPDHTGLQARLASAKKSTAMASVLGEIVRLKEAERCPRLNGEGLQALFDASLKNPNLQDIKANLLVLRGRAYRTEGNHGLALRSLDEAFSIIPNKEIAFQQMVWASEAGMIDQAREYAEKVKRSTTGNRRHDELIDRQIAN